VIVTRRPKYACRSCTDGVVQAPAPNRLIEGGLPTEALIADVLVSKYADHLPLYRQTQILAREGVNIDRSTLTLWVGFAAHELAPLHDRLVAILKSSPKLFADETRCPVLDPGRGRTKTGYLWAIARDDRAWAGADPPAIAYTYAPGRGGGGAIKTVRRPGRHRPDQVVAMHRNAWSSSPECALCQRRSHFRPVWRSKGRPLMAPRVKA
jgi:hypothetical protein